MSKRWKVRKRNAAKLEKHYETMDRFYANVIGSLEDLKKQMLEKKDNKP